MAIKKQTSEPDLSFARAARLVVASRQELHIILVGCGGTGSWLAPSIARLARVLKESGRDLRVVFVDHDRVEEKNIPRQNFCDAELGMNKAIALAHRYSAAWGVEIAALPGRFNPQKARGSYNTLTVIVGCVDNASARRSISDNLKWHDSKDVPSCWWLDCGNASDSGQVLLGSAARVAQLEGAFTAAKVCRALPSPALQMPDLLAPRPEELSGTRMSCAEMMAANMQSLAINQRVAAEAADYLMRMLTGQPLTRFATFFDLQSGSARSRAITPEEVARVINKPVSYVRARSMAAAG